MNIIKSFEEAFKRAIEKNWETIYVLVDIHGTIFKPSYYKEEKYEFYPYSRETLQLLTKNTKVKLILWSSTTKEALQDYNKIFRDNEINFNYFNCNPEVEALPTDPNSSDFSSKFYFNVGLDDKFGFEPEKDWFSIYNYFLETKKK